MDDRIGDNTKIANNTFFIFLGLLFYLFSDAAVRTGVADSRLLKTSFLIHLVYAIPLQSFITTLPSGDGRLDSQQDCAGVRGR
jgi:ABC-type siderophore export system fused ATPase/permease subunit